ncbi:uncharacterized protein MAM_05381 [Metarhizium album ARSEF 1941]|uniref:Uncharacterized protein n=1 Tax=Metarhizium album (strain ARSEF 1941) TaxID=1081103 RepID=A0A0B2WVA5_METAS|nr:uncharacterized protein MAM_05381 [Metarhizium album ARSEF 1941]KHN96825.1 hypothetical protein MAM_05381 [Metarhizium album ARSEF 1941]
MGIMWEPGRDLEGTDPDEYCDSRLLEACDIGRERLLRREGVDVEVANGGKEAWFAFAEGDEPCGWETGEDEAFVMVAVAVIPRRVAQGGQVTIAKNEGSRSPEDTTAETMVSRKVE